MIRAVVLSLALLPLAAAAEPIQLTSDYTKVDQQTGCHIIGTSGDGEGDWADLVCPGYGNYPYVIRYGDGRETITYGFGAGSGMPGFGRFNYANDTVEWRLSNEDGGKRPVAAIQRWFLADLDGKWTTQVLVVSKVGQPEGGGACVIGYVAADDGAAANERARLIADRAPEFGCGGDDVTVEPAIREYVSLD